MDKNDLLSTEQHAFHSGTSSATQLLQVLEQRTRDVDGGHSIDRMYFRLSKGLRQCATPAPSSQAWVAWTWRTSTKLDKGVLDWTITKSWSERNVSAQCECSDRHSTRKCTRDLTGSWESLKDHSQLEQRNSTLQDHCEAYIRILQLCVVRSRRMKTSEKVQQIAARLIPDLWNLEYPDRLLALKLPTL